MDNKQENIERFETPGDMLRSMLQGKGWTQDSLATITKTTRTTINNIIKGRTGITPDIAVALADAFGNEPTDWMKADVDYRLSLVKRDNEIAKRGRLFEIAPVSDMIRRGWINATDSTESLHNELNRFFGEDVLEKGVIFPIAARRVNKLSELNISEKAWCFRARKLAESLTVSSFSREKLNDVEKKLRKLAAYPKEVRRLPKVLSNYGIRLVVVEPIPGVKIDGAAFWIEKEPVIAMSIRYDRIDGFWFTLMHEFAHIRNGDAFSVDTDLVGNTKGISVNLVENDAERLANEQAANTLIPTSEMESFIGRVGPLYSKERVIQFAHRIKIHPGIIVGQLQHRKEIGYASLRGMLVKVRGVIVETALTDGWNQMIKLI